MCFFIKYAKTPKLNLPPPSRFNFQIRRNNTSDGYGNYSVDCRGSSKLQGAVLEIIRKRPKQNDLHHLLVRLSPPSFPPHHAYQSQEMLASYLDILSRRCARCSRLLDRNAQFPIVRSEERIKQPDGQVTSQWSASHTACPPGNQAITQSLRSQWAGYS